MASQNVSNDVKTSLGPVGLDRMLMDDTFGGITVSTDCAAIFKMLEIEHPAANVFDITRNPVTACQAASNNVKTSVGPVGLLDRMLMDDTFGDNITITNDCVNILRMLEAEHPDTKNRPEKGCEDKCLSKLKRRLKNKLKSRRFTQKYY
ncbi:PREDICTED: probable T-complex protein 1 subunit eta [Camelina sativa]|uniref:Probable T-complex protein 1 subunit eta n=1 Tax=Camelina sativa TaxID=90675 RepID=A0ABM0ZAU3_CAMSA|nr:PREDICTED: probable T-complex protein 1 subunit eta [Camelina sativa]